MGGHSTAQSHTPLASPTKATRSAGVATGHSGVGWPAAMTFACGASVRSTSGSPEGSPA